MTNIPVPQARYKLLMDETKIRIVSNKKVCLVVTAAILGLAIAGFILLVFNLRYCRQGFQLPNFYESEVFPQSWVERAIKYNSIDESELKAPNTAESLLKHSRTNPSPEYKLVCYYSVLSSTKNYLKSSQIDPNLCTHIIVGFIGIKNNSIAISTNANETIINITGLKRLNKNLKVLISIGGADGDSGFAEMVFNHSSRKMFIKSAVSAIKEYKLDGIDLDWEFPNEKQHGDKKQRMHFTQLLREIREEIKRHTKPHQFLLTVAVAAPTTIVDHSYDISYMNDYVDFVNLMSYDYHFYTKMTPFTGFNAPLYPHAREIGYFKTLNINNSAFYWHGNGMDKSKIIVGLPTYGHSFTLMNPSNNGLTAPASGYGRMGDIGFVDYSDICWFLSYYQIKAIFDLEAKSPYAFKGTEWISFEDMQSLSYKTEFIKENNFGGAMILSLNTDDYNGACGQKYNQDDAEVTFPLTRKVKSILYDDQL